MLELKGKIFAVLPEESGTSAKGEWRKQTAILEYGDKYPKKCPFEMWKDKIVPLAVGQQVTLVFDIDAREWNGKWFTTVNAFKVVTTDAAGPAPIVSVPMPAPTPDPIPTDDGTSLPF